MDVLDNTGLFNASDYTFDGIITYLWNRRGKVEAATHIPSGTTLAVKRYDLEKCHQDLDLIQVIFYFILLMASGSWIGGVYIVRFDSVNGVKEALGSRGMTVVKDRKE